MQMLAIFQHHKNAKKMGNRPIQYLLSQEHVQEGMGYLMHGWKWFPAESSKLLFVSKTGVPLLLLTVWWKDLLTQYQAPFKYFAPRYIREVVVVERRTHSSVTGTTNVGAAMIMGNSLEQWDKTYDKTLNQREAQAAIDGHAAWRQAVCSSV